MSENVIPRRFDAPTYAASSLAPPQTFVERFSTPVRTASAVIGGLHHKNASSSALSPLQQSIAMGGGLVLATFATLTDPRKSLGMGHALAVGSWVAALYGGKWVHNALANLKTGLNLNQGYFDSSGQRRQLFENPQAIPFQLIPEERFNWTGDRLGIPYTQQRRRLIEEKIQQTTVQNQTWWLLSAGLGLPVFTMGLRDLLQNAAQGLAGKVISSYHLTRARQFREAPVLAERSLDAYLDQQLGAHKFSWLSRWRKRFEETLVKRLELPRHIGLKNALRLDDKALSQAIRSRLESFLTQPDQRLSLMAMKSFLKEETERLDAMNHNVVNLKALRALPPELYHKAEARLLHEYHQAHSHVSRYATLFEKLLEGDMTPQALNRQLNVIGSTRWLKTVAAGRLDLAASGDLMPDAFTKALTRLQATQGVGLDKMICELSDQAGPVIRDHLLTITRNGFDKFLWNRRVFGLMAGALTAATALYYALVVGETQPRSGGRP